MAAPLIEPDGTVVVGTSFDAASAVALRRAVSIARTFDVALRIAHAVPCDQPPLRVREADLQIAVTEWAIEEARIVIDPRTVVCRLDEPAMSLARVAVESNASLVVIGASRPRVAPGVAERLHRIAGIPILVAQSPRKRAAIVAATDLIDKEYPVARAAAAWAEACAAHVTLIHNLETVPTSRESKRSMIGPALRDLFFLTRSLGPIHRAHLSRGPRTTAAIMQLVKAQSADLIVVGARRARGRTMNELLGSTGSSVLVVPLDGG